MPIKYKTKATKVQMTSEEAERRAKEAAEEAARVETQRLRDEQREAERQRQAWDARPGPVPIGWGSAVDLASGLEFYWRQDDPIGTRTWERPACSGEAPDEEEVKTLVEELCKRPRVPRGFEWQLAMQRLWEEEPVDPICNWQRPGSKGSEDVLNALSLVRFFFKGAMPHKLKAYQDLLATERHVPHEKLPPHLHSVRPITRMVELLAHDDSDVQRAAACAVAAACTFGHRGCQDQVAMTGNAMPLLVNMLLDEHTIQAALLAIGRACEGSHKGNQNALAMVHDGASTMLDLLDHEDGDVAKTAQFAIYWACSNASKATRVYWERSRGYCMSLVAPQPPVHQWEAATCHKEQMKIVVHSSKSVANTGPRASVKAQNLAKRRPSYMTMGEKALQLFEDVPDPNEVPYNERSRTASKNSRLTHIPVESQQAPQNSHLHLVSRRASKRMTEGLDGPSALPAPMLALPGEPEHPGHEPDTIESERSMPREQHRRPTQGSLEEDAHDLHQLDPALDDAETCMIGMEVRHCAQTGFLKPTGARARFGIVT